MTTKAASKQIIVIGSGLAGLTSAFTALNNGFKVTVLELESRFGGNSIKASSGINGAPTRFQTQFDDLFYQDTLISSGEIYQSSNNKEEREMLMKTLVNNSQSAIYFLTEKIGVDLSVVSQLGGHSRPRTHRGSGKLPPGFAIISTLLKKIESDFKDTVTLKSECKVTKLLMDENKKVIGVEYEDIANDKVEKLFGPVIVSAGGFAGDTTGLIKKYRPDLVGYPSTNSPKPEFLSLLTAAGAQLMDMESIQVHPTGFVDTNDDLSQVKFLAAEALRGHGGIMVTPQGDRFVNEVMRRDQVTEAVIKACPVLKSDQIKQWDTYLVMDQGSVDSIKPSVDFYMFKKLMFKDKLSQLGIKLPNLKKTLIKYSENVQNEKDLEFSRGHYGSWSLKPNEISDDTEIYYGKTTPVLHFTMGGAKINQEGEFLNEQNNPIQGIWGAGEITSGVHSSNRLGGSSLLECVVFGRIVGNKASNALESHL